MHPTSGKRKRRGWAPDDTDHQVYQWVKFDGTKQIEVALRLGIDQSTVSRIVQRYEKWQAHATPATDGRLSHEERRRAQRWLTYERNERIVASAQRLADEMARSIDASKTVITQSDLSDERRTRTELFVMDRTQMAARFLRLAQKVGMDNLKLVELEPLPELPPLEEEEVAEQVAEATAATREVKAAKEAAERSVEMNQTMRERIDAEVALAVATEVAKRMKAWEEAQMEVVGGADEVVEDDAAAPGESASNSRGSLRDPQPPRQESQPPSDAGASRSFRPRQEPGTESKEVHSMHPTALVIRQSDEPAVVEVQVHNVHKMHNRITPKTDASAGTDESYERNSPPENSDGNACILPTRSRGSLRDPQPPNPL